MEVDGRKCEGRLGARDGLERKETVWWRGVGGGGGWTI